MLFGHLLTARCQLSRSATSGSRTRGPTPCRRPLQAAHVLSAPRSRPRSPQRAHLETMGTPLGRPSWSQRQHATCSERHHGARRHTPHRLSPPTAADDGADRPAAATVPVATPGRPTIAPTAPPPPRCLPPPPAGRRWRRPPRRRHAACRHPRPTTIAPTAPPPPRCLSPPPDDRRRRRPPRRHDAACRDTVPTDDVAGHAGATCLIELLCHRWRWLPSARHRTDG